MTVTAEMILTDFGSKLPLDRRRKDALADLAKGEARRAGISPERWARETWDLKAYEAKDLVRGNASETIWERIIKHPNGGWRIALPILGAVIGQGIGEFFAAEAERARHDAERRQQEATELAQAERAARAAIVRLVSGGGADDRSALGGVYASGSDPQSPSSSSERRSWMDVQDSGEDVPEALISRRTVGGEP
jgi:hypothetical protein